MSWGGAPDITSEGGKQQASEGRSALSAYLRRMGDMPRDAFEKMFDNSVDRTCSISCEPSNYLMGCGQNFLPFHVVEDSEEGHVEVIPAPGMYLVPLHCEYCGAERTQDCVPECQRPKLFFRKKRPPFCPRAIDKWDPDTDYMIETEAATIVSPPKEKGTGRWSRSGWRRK
mmetsp:Transcript_26134/g.38298  ORF Transcript_26134/g.38298 Transcript_26134/m.38298 type:complete len:171 (-) Transcript_26134:1464-1976(-)